MKDGFKPAKPGIHFDLDSGKLYLFKFAIILVIRLWPLPAAWKKTITHPYFVHCRPQNIFLPRGDLTAAIQNTINPVDRYGQLLLPCCLTPQLKRVYRRDRNQLQWFATVPEDVRNLVSPFHNRQFHLLSFLSRCGSAATDLAVSNPALAYMLSNNWVFHKPAVQRPLRSARALLSPGKTQRQILEWLHFPGTKNVQKILAKVLPKSLHIPRLLYLRQALENEQMRKKLSHLHRLNSGVLRIITCPQLHPIADFSLLEEISHLRYEDEWPFNSRILEDCQTMFNGLYPNKKFPPQRSLKQLRELHDSLTNDMYHTSVVKNTDFPPPPLRGTSTIKPLTSYPQILKEAETMHNCLASYVEQVLILKDIYFYKVLKPERCTLALRRQKGKWVLSELKSAFNKTPSRDAFNVVMNWLGDEAWMASQSQSQLDFNIQF